MRQFGENAPSKGGFPWLVAILLLPAIYVLSVGPMNHFHRQLPGAMQEIVERFYDPLEWLYESHQLIKAVLDWYMGLFN